MRTRKLGNQISSDLRGFEAETRMGRIRPIPFTDLYNGDGRRLKIICTCIDSGGHFTTQVYRFCKERTARRVFAIKGKGGAEVPYFNRPSTSNNVKTPLFTVGVDTGKAPFISTVGSTGRGAELLPFSTRKRPGVHTGILSGIDRRKNGHHVQKRKSAIRLDAKRRRVQKK